jgi:zinc protease
MNRLKTLLLLFAFAAALAQCATNQKNLTPNSQDLQPQVFEKTLANGLKVLILEEHKSPIATFQLWYRVGSRNERPGITGISHFLEHLMYKSTDRYDAKHFSSAVTKVGGIHNAFTSKDETAFFQNLASDRLDLSLELESTRMRGLRLLPEEIESERKVVMEERRLMLVDDPRSHLYEKVVEKAFTVHPYQWSPIGSMEDIEKITRENLLEHYNTYYVPNNAFIVVTGDVKPDELIVKIEKAFGAIPKGKPAPTPQSVEPPQTQERRLTLKRKAELPYLLFAYKIPNITHPDAPALEILSMIMGHGKSSRLYQRLTHERQIALSVDTLYSGENVDPYLFFFSATPAANVTVQTLEQALDQEIESIKNAPPSEKELQKAKNQIESFLVKEQDSIYSSATLLASFEFVGGWRLKDAYIEKLKSVTPQQVSEAARRHLVKERRTVGVLIPEK